MRIAIFFIFISVLFFSGCWYYSFTDRPYPDIKSTFVAPFDNETDRYDLAPLLAERLIDRIQGSGIFDIAGRATAQSIISGTIVSYTKEAHSYTSAEEPIEFIVRVKARVAFTKTASDKPLWESTFDGFAMFPVDESTKDESTARTEAVSMLVDRILERLRQG